MNALNNLFLDELADRYDAEKRLIRALPKMARAATCKKLQKLIQSHLKKTIGHVKKLGVVFKSFGAKVKAHKCEATIGLLKEGGEIAADFKGSTAINAALISVAQKVAHHEIASYGCLREWAALLGNREISDVLKNVMAEEKAANQALIILARSSCNNEALGVAKRMVASSKGKSAKPSAARRGLRPLNLKRTRPSLM